MSSLYFKPANIISTEQASSISNKQALLYEVKHFIKLYIRKCYLNWARITLNEQPLFQMSNRDSTKASGEFQKWKK